MNPNQLLLQDVKVGDYVRFEEEVKKYKIQARNVRYLVLNKPLTLRDSGGRVTKTTLYTIVDLVEQVRGPENLVFGLGAETQYECEEMLARIIDGETEISHRHRIPLVIRKVIIDEDKDGTAKLSSV